jgi:integrase/recombinase XerD
MAAKRGGGNLPVPVTPGNVSVRQKMAMATRTESIEDVHYFTRDEVHRILTDELRRDKWPAYVLILFLWHTGARISEALEVQVKNINLQTKNVTLRSLKKRGEKAHYRRVPIDKPEITMELAAWIHTKRLAFEDRLFGITRKTGYNWVHDACAAAGFDDARAHPHTFRHGYAMNLLLQRIDLPRIQLLMGHSDITKTLIYTQIANRDFQMMMDHVEF